MVVHTLISLVGAIESRHPTVPLVWSTFYDIRRYGGLQIFLRAVLPASLVLSSAPGIDGGFSGSRRRARSHAHFRNAVTLAASADEPAATAGSSIRPLVGEIADQAILDQLQSFYPQAASPTLSPPTEAGVAIRSEGRLAGFPAKLIENIPASK